MSHNDVEPRRLRRARVVPAAFLALALTAGLAACDATAGQQPAPSGPPAASDLQPFDPDAPAGEAPTDLDDVFGFPGSFDDPQSLAFGAGIRDAFESRGGSYTVAVANGDLSKIADQTQQMFAQHIAAMFQYPYEEQATRDLSQEALDRGMSVFAYARPYSTLQFIQDEASVGTAIGAAAATWIEENLDGEAHVFLFNNDTNDPNSIPRHEATLATLAELPGVEIVADVTETGGTEDAANQFATIYQQHPEIDVVLGDEFGSMGAFSVLDAQGLGNSDDIYISVLAAADDALAELASGDSAIKAAFLYPWPLLGYGVGQFAADWLEGKSIPRLVVPPNGAVIEVSSADDVQRYRDDMSDPAATWNDETAREGYVTLWGNISYATRDTYWTDVAGLPSAMTENR